MTRFSEKIYNLNLELFASDTDRTYESGYSQLLGIYSPELCTQTLNSFQMKNALPPFKIDDEEKIISELGEKALPNCLDLKPIFSEKDEVDFITHFEKSDCKSYKQMQRKLKESEEFKAYVKPIVDYLDPRLNELTKLNKTLTVDEMGKICSYIYIADFHNKTLIFDYNQTDISMCKKMISYKSYYISFGHEFLWKIGSKEFYERLITSMHDVVSGKKTTKLTLNFSHDFMISIILNGLGELDTEFVEFAANIFFELHKIDNEYFVKTLYNQVPLKFGDCKEELCKLSTFSNYIRSIHFSGDIQKLCNNTALESFISGDHSNDFLRKAGPSQEPNGLFSFFKAIDYETLAKFLIFAIVFIIIGYALAKIKQKRRFEEKMKDEYFANLLKYERIAHFDREETKNISKSMV